MLIIAVLIRLGGEGPVLFRQRRHGFNNEIIEVLKFRTMRAASETEASVRQVSPNDERVTPVGRWLRRLSLDELPQLWNVLRGDMSLVGPRPHAIGMKAAGRDAERLVAEYAWRHRMKPGLTGWAQVNGSIGPVDAPELVRRRVALDIDYIERQSLLFDLLILALTPRALLRAARTVR
jgi:lipopolysaccharide/colanic/teichoic acid biosynthesis glycosyltransferase